MPYSRRRTISSKSIPMPAIESAGSRYRRSIIDDMVIWQNTHRGTPTFLRLSIPTTIQPVRACEKWNNTSHREHLSMEEGEHSAGHMYDGDPEDGGWEREERASPESPPRGVQQMIDMNRGFGSRNGSPRKSRWPQSHPPRHGFPITLTATIAAIHASGPDGSVLGLGQTIPLP